MRDPERVGEPPRAQHRLGRAAAFAPSVARIGPELQRHRDHLAPRPRSRSAATAVSTPPLTSRPAPARRGGRPREGALRAGGRPQSARWSASAASCGRVALAGPEAAELGLDPTGPISAASSERRALSQLGAAAAAARGSRRSPRWRS